MVSTPKPPDPWKTAQAQSQWNSTTAQTQQALNMVDQVTPTGSLNYSQNGTQTIIGADGKPIELPRYTATTTLSPEQQAIFSQTQQAQGNLAGLAAEQSAAMREYLKGGVDTSNLPELAKSSGVDADFARDIGGNYTAALGPGFATSYAGADDFSNDRARVEEALWQRGASDRASQEETLRTRLLNSGVREGSAAWNAEMERLGRQTTDARLATTLAGGQEQSRLVDLARNAAIFGNEAELARAGFGNQASLGAAQFAQNAQQAGNAAALTDAQFANSARGQGLQEAMALRNQPINELSALMSGAQVSMPQFQSTPQTGVAGVDYTGLVNQKYQADLANSQAMMGGLFGLGGSLLGAAGQAGGLGMLFSDERLKEDVERVGETDEGVPVYTYRYKGTPGGIFHMGVMADELEDTQPEAVRTHPSGYRMVDYKEVR
ncbi:tail fiber domain-containing protein [Devosia nitrariae]|uniref:Peptidase S74 domain-containing protein n=1 Tax=Devosia nitrariae TaxID=2071872 RepID=A0ABQ5W204_9HYPH|nr:tail fiber domain-containing protein [Devosia nitrariae]GLQ53753.1 hypothetical protein GCM10010862_10120 [Devosia nitrariae]